MKYTSTCSPSVLFLLSLSLFRFSLLLRSSFAPVHPLSLTLPLRHGGKHSQSFSPFCDSISADIAAVSLDSSIRSNEDAAVGDIFARDGEKGREEDRKR